MDQILSTISALKIATFSQMLWSFVLTVTVLIQHDSKHWLTRNLCLQSPNPTLKLVTTT